MKVFSGFPAGKLQVTPLPNVFFTDLLPSIDDLAELKLTLHFFWLAAYRKNRVQYVTASELRADGTLIQSLAAAGMRSEDALARALDLATKRGALLTLDVTDDQDSVETLYFMNTESGRKARDTIEKSRLTRGAPIPEPATPDERPNIFVLYEQNIGFLTPIIADELKEAEREYPEEWVQDAFKEAALHNALNWKYIRAILERWKTEGRQGYTKKRKHWWDDEFDEFIKR